MSDAATTDQPLDILIVTGGFPLLSQSFVERKVVALAQRGHRVTVLAGGPGDHELDPALVAAVGGRLRVERAPGGPRLVRAAGVIAATLRSLGRDPRFACRLVGAIYLRHGGIRSGWRALAASSRLAGRRPDVVHIEWALKAMPLVEALALVPAAVVVSCRGSEVRVMATADPRLAQDLARVFAQVDAVHCVSAAVADAAVACGLDRSKAFVNHPAIDPDDFTPVPGGGRAGPPLRIVSVGRIHWVKGYEHALQALRLLVDRGCDAHYTIAGAGEAEAVAAVQFAVHDLGLAERVSFTGPLQPNAVRHLLGDAHVFLLPSLSEGLSNAALEAMAMARPVVVSDVGGMGELVRDGVEGYLVPARQPAVMADRLERLAVDESLRSALGEAGRARVCESFHLDGQTDRFVEHYRLVIAARGTTR